MQVRHHPGYGGECPREFLTIEGEAEVRLENCTSEGQNGNRTRQNGERP